MDNAVLGKYIKKRREALGLSQEKLAGKLYVTRQAVYSWEKGKTAPDWEKYDAIAEALGVPKEELEKAGKKQANDLEYVQMLYDPEHMSSFIKSAAHANKLKQTAKALMLAKKLHELLIYQTHHL